MVFNKRRYRATIQDKEYTIVGSKTDEHMDVVIHQINDQLAQLKKMNEKMTTEEAAILIAINAVSHQLTMEEEKWHKQEADDEKQEESSL